MNAETQSTEAGASSAPAEKQLANIVRGTFPRALVYLVRFGEDKEAKESDLAKKYGTTNGKIADIQKNRNFAYIDEGFRPTQEDKDAALKWLKQVPNYDEVGTDSAVTALERLDIASEEDVKALAAKRADVRARNAATSGEGQPAASTGGGSKGGSRKGGKKDKAEGSKTATAEELMQ